MPISYSKSGVNYSAIDPTKKLAQNAAKSTAKNLKSSGFSEIETTRGESAYVWKQGSVYMASVVEGLGTKNLVADTMYQLTGRTYYDTIAHDTVASIINDLTSVGARPLTIHAYWAVGDSNWLKDRKRMKDLIAGWKSACDLSQVSWGGGETPALSGIINPATIDLGGSAVGIIKNKKHLITEKNLKPDDRILLLKSNGINMNGLSLARALAEKLSSGYQTKLPNGKMYGEALLTKSNIYAKLIKNLFKAGIDIHYLSNITGHGLRKVMRARQKYTYVLEHIFDSSELFNFIQGKAGLSDYEMYQTFNMGQDYAIFISSKNMKKAMAVVKKNGFVGLDAGYVEKGPKQVIIKAKNLVYKGETLDLR